MKPMRKIISGNKFAFDKGTVRTYDADGRLHVSKTAISKSNINPYYGKEIPGYESLGLEPEKIYRLYRDPVELERGAKTFERIPILSKHVPISVDTPRPDLVIGAIGSDVSFSEPYLFADLCFWDSTSIAGIEEEKVKELSCSYRYIPVMEPGEVNGEPYDGRMTEIQGNHLALVEIGRAGSDVVVSDHNPFTFKESAMKMTKLGKALFAALSGASPVLAADSAVPALVGSASRKNFNPKEVKKKLLALDSELNPEHLDNILDAILGIEDEPDAVEPKAAAVDESPVGKLRALLEGKVDEQTINDACDLFPATPAEDEEEEEMEEKGMKEEDVKAAMDSLRKDLRLAEEARRDVRDVVGDVLGMDSAADVYAFALDHMEIDHKDVEGAAALRALFKVASKKVTVDPAAFALDSDGMAVKFPGATRFRQA